MSFEAPPPDCALQHDPSRPLRVISSGSGTLVDPAPKMILVDTTASLVFFSNFAIIFIRRLRASEGSSAMLERNQLPLRPAAPGFAAAWVAVIAGASVALSLVFACVTPFVALAAVSAVVLPRRMALMAVLLAWLANQTVGYLVLGYPETFDSFAWGLAIGVAAFASLAAALGVLRLAAGLAVTMTGAFLAGFVAYEGVLFAATAVLPSGDAAFSAAVVAEVLLINSLAAIGLICLHAGAAASGALVAAQPAPVPR